MNDIVPWNRFGTVEDAIYGGEALHKLCGTESVFDVTILINFFTFRKRI